MQGQVKGRRQGACVCVHVCVCVCHRCGAPVLIGRLPGSNVMRCQFLGPCRHGPNATCTHIHNVVKQELCTFLKGKGKAKHTHTHTHTHTHLLYAHDVQTWIGCIEVAQ